MIGALTTERTWDYPAKPTSVQSRLAACATYLAAHARGMNGLVDQVVTALNGNDANDWPMRRAALFAADAAATASPAQFFNSPGASHLRQRILATATDPLSYSVRLLSISVLSHFRRLDPQVLNLVATACRDEHVVATSVLRRCQTISVAQEPSLDEIAELVGSQHMPTVMAAALLSSSLARSPDTSASQRRTAEEALASAVRSRNPAMDVIGDRNGRSLRTLLHGLLTGVAWHTEPSDMVAALGSALVGGTDVFGSGLARAFSPPQGARPLLDVIRELPRGTNLTSKQIAAIPIGDETGYVSWDELGLADLAEPRRTHLKAAMYSALEFRVGTVIANRMTPAQLDEFERLFEIKDEAGAFNWLQSNFPNYPQAVDVCRKSLFSELRSSLRDVERVLKDLFRGENDSGQD